MIQVNASKRLKVMASADDAAILKYVGGALANSMNKADVKAVSFKFAGSKLTLYGFGTEAIVTQKALDRYSSIEFTVEDIKAFLEANGAKPAKKGSSSKIKASSADVPKILKDLKSVGINAVENDPDGALEFKAMSADKIEAACRKLLKMGYTPYSGTLEANSEGFFSLYLPGKKNDIGIDPKGYVYL